MGFRFLSLAILFFLTPYKVAFAEESSPEKVVTLKGKLTITRCGKKDFCASDATSYPKIEIVLKDCPNDKGAICEGNWEASKTFEGKEFKIRFTAVKHEGLYALVVTTDPDTNYERGVGVDLNADASLTNSFWFDGAVTSYNSGSVSYQPGIFVSSP